MLEHWYAALAEPFGIVLEVVEGTKERVIQKLYAARAEAGDADLASLSIVQSPTSPTQIWIVKREEVLNEPPESHP